MKTFHPRSATQHPLYSYAWGCAATLLASFCLLPSSATAAGHALKTAQGDLLLSNADGKSIVQRPDGQRIELPLPKGARVSDLHTGDKSQWYAAAVSHDDGGPQMRLFRGQGSELAALATPSVASVKELMQPVFVADTDIRALVWLAGDAHHQMAVQAALWIDGGWSSTGTISPPGKGTQIALSTAVLADDTLLVVWAAFDGQDDEIVWSRHTAEGWSKPEPIAADNSVPDITPSLYPTQDGALVAWSRYDGDAYRVNVARFDGTSWSQPTIAGPPGSTGASFSDAGEPYLIYRRPAEGAWAVMALDTAGHVRQDASLVVPETQRPNLAGVTPESVTLEWSSLEKQHVSTPLRWIKR